MDELLSGLRLTCRQPHSYEFSPSVSTAGLARWRSQLATVVSTYRVLKQLKQVFGVHLGNRKRSKGGELPGKLVGESIGSGTARPVLIGCLDDCAGHGVPP